MRDTKSLDKEAVSFIQSKLLFFGYSCADPSYDIDGCDFFAINKEKDESKLIKVQSKGRNITNKASNVEIYKNYVKENFVCFIYLKKESLDDGLLYMYCCEDIKKWKEKSGKDEYHNKYVLSISKNFIEEDCNKQFLFNRNRCEKLDQIFEKPKSIDIKVIDSLNILQSFYTLWQRYNIRPDAAAMKLIDENVDIAYCDDGLFIFTCCMFVILEDDGDFYGIDWAVQYIRTLIPICDLEESKIKTKENIYDSNYGIAYRCHVNEIIYDDAIEGFHLYIGDEEEKYDLYLLRDGRHGVVKYYKH